MSALKPALPDSVPVMVLEGATLFPQGCMPLFIFEPRYRSMLRYALERDRLFCIGHARARSEGTPSGESVHRITTVGLIRACVQHPDGTSHLMLSGVERVEILGWHQRAPFRIASIVPRPCQLTDPIAARAQAQTLLDLLDRCVDPPVLSPILRHHLRETEDPRAIADIVGQSLVTHSPGRQGLLEIDEVEDRLAYLIAYCRALYSKEA